MAESEAETRKAGTADAGTGRSGTGNGGTETAASLLERIRQARDWAAEEERKLRIVGEQVGSADDLAYAVNYVAYGAVREVLDEILEPGVHAPEGG